MATMSKNMREVYAKALEISGTLRADDPRFNNTVHIICEDGSSFLWDSAFFERFHEEGGDYVAVFAEHYAVQVFAEDECLGIRMWGPRLK